MHTLHQQTRFDLRLLWGITGALIVIGCIFIYSASSVYALETFGSSIFFLKKQLLGLLISFVILALMRFIPMWLIRSFSPWFFIATLGMTMLTLTRTFAITIHGSSRWLRLPGIAFQPSELLKISLILYVAHLLAKKEFSLASFVRGYLPFLIILGLTSVILLKQPDFGLTVTLCATVFMLLFIAHFQSHHLLATLASLVPVLGALIYLKPYRLKRVVTFLNPWNDPQGAGFQIIQSLIAIGSGGIWGTGISNSKQKFFYLPMQHTDFIFSIIAEESGFVGCFIVCTLFILFLYTGLRIAWRMNNSFYTFATIGFVLIISLQAIINIFVVTGLLPTKGIGLPFISYGLSSLISNIIMIGLIAKMAHEPEYA